MTKNNKKFSKYKLCCLCGRFPQRSGDLCGTCRQHLDNLYKHLESPMKECECGFCHELIHSIGLSGLPLKFAPNHQNRGENHPLWKGGESISPEGYKIILREDRFENKKPKRYGYDHRKAYEIYYNCCLLPWVQIHHIDRNKQNNFDIKNLMPIYSGEHTRLHLLEDRYPRN